MDESPSTANTDAPVIQRRLPDRRASYVAVERAMVYKSLDARGG